MGRVLVGLVAVALVGAGAAMWLRASHGSRGGSPTHEYRYFIALDADRALEYHGGIGGPFVIEAMQLHAGALTSRWEWNGAQNTGSYSWEWTHRGDLFAGELHTATGTEQNPRLIVVNWSRGVVTTVGALDSGAFAFADDHVVVAVAGDRVRLIDAALPDGGREWHAALPPRPFTVRHVAGTPRHAVVWDGTLRVFDRADPSEQRTLGPLTDVVGVAATREEALVLRDGKLAVLSLADGTERIAVDLVAGGGVTDGIDDPCLMGASGGNWIVLYATSLVQGFQVNGASWSVPASKMLAAVDAATGNVAWSTPLGNWDLRCTDSPFQYELPRDRELSSPMMVRGSADVQGGRGRIHGMLAAIDLATGALRWQTEYAGEGGSNAFDAHRGHAFYTRADGSNVLLRFEDGRLTGASRLGPMFETIAATSATDSGVWVSGESWQMLAAPDLRVIAGVGDRGVARAALSAAVRQYSVPPSGQ